jgi:membrane protein
VSRPLARFDGLQRRHAAAAVPVAVARKFLDDRASNLAALVAYYAFFSLFPLLLVLVSVTGFVLEGDPALQDDVVDSALARVPVVGAQLGDEIDPLTGSTVALVVGLAGALWAGLGVTVALGRAFDQMWDVPRFEQRGGIAMRARGLAVLTVIGVALMSSTALAGLTVGGGLGEGAERVGALAGALAGNLVGFFAVFALLTGRPMQPRALLPGVVVAAAGGLVLQAVGGWYVDATVARASDTYGTFALVIGLLSWFWLGSHLLLAAAELNVVLARRLWPRALTGALCRADHRALQDSARAARRDERQHIAVSFVEGGARHPGRTPDRPIAAAAGRVEDGANPSSAREPPS